MLRLFAGRENIDKERFIYDRVKEHGGETLVLVPDQYTLVAEEQALKYLGTDCLFSVEITSMNRLGLRILTEQGTESVKMIDKYGRFMLLSMLIREHVGDFDIFSRVAGKLTFTSMLNDFISEFKQQDCTLEKLQEMLGDAGGDPILEAKLKELSGVIAAYEEAIKGRYTDSEDYIAMYVSAIKDSKLVRGKSIWIYGYDSITPKFADAVIELANTAESVSFIVNMSDFGLDRRLTSSLTLLGAEKGVNVGTFLIDPSYGSAKSETVRRMEKALWKDVLSPAERAENADYIPEDLTVVCAANPYYEAESAAAYVWHLIRDLGYKMREIQLIANDEGAMQPIIRRVFAEYGLPVFADTSRDITDSAAVGFIVNLLEFLVHRKSSQYLFAMLKTGLTDYDDSDIEDLENYAKAYRIKGSMWDKPFKFTADIYHKYITDLIPYQIDNLRIRYLANNDAVGYATGVSLRLNGEFVEGIESWASLSLMQTQEKLFDNETQTWGGWQARPTDQRLSFKLFFQDYLPSLPWWQMSLNFVYGTGFPFTKPFQTDFSVTHRLPSYFRVDWGNSVHLKKIEKIKNAKWLQKIDDVVVSVDVFNLFNYKNVVSYLWVADYDNKYYGVPNYLTARQINAKLTVIF